MIDVLGNDSSDPDTGETLTITTVTSTTTGATVEVASDGLSVLYTPVTDFIGTDTFTYMISDGNGGEATAMATIEVVEFVPGSLSGLVYVDSNDNGVAEQTERVLEGITVTLTGMDIFGSVDRTTMTAADGSYEFANLAPGDFVITQTQPAEDLDADGIPLLDGKDTIGSQGGVVGKDGQGNDTFTITLAEGVIGTDNNFGEVKGRTIQVMVESGSGVMAEGYEVHLLQDGEEVRTTSMTDSMGEASFAGLTPGTYQVQVSGPFLLNGTSDVVVGDQGAVVLVSIGEPEINPIFPTYLDSLSSRSSSFANVAVGTTQQHWLALGAGWQDTTNVQVRMAPGGNAIELTIDDAEGTFQGTISKTNGLLNVLNQMADGTSRIRLNGSSADFKAVLTQVNMNGSGEGEAVSPAVGTTTSMVAQDPTSSPVAQTVPDAPKPVTSTASTSLVATPTIIGDSSLPPLDAGEGESVSNRQAKLVDDLFSLPADKGTITGDTLELVHEDSEEQLGALDLAYAELAGGTLVDTLDGPLVS